MDLKIPSEFVEIHKQTMKWIENDQEHWNQSVWARLTDHVEWFNNRFNLQPLDLTDVCNTQFCYMGRALVLRGYRIVASGLNTSGIDPQGNKISLPRAAGRDLGLSGGQISEIYSMGSDDFASFKEEMSQLLGIDFD